MREKGLVVFIRSNSADEARHAIDIALESKLNIVEVTMNTPDALNLIRSAREANPDTLIVGAGTVLDPETARTCILAGAKFIVSPHMNPEVIATCRRYTVTCIPGTLTATEVVAAWEAGADFCKIFPAASVGGPSYLKYLKGPLPQIEMIPTGGVTPADAADYIRAGAAAVGIKSDIIFEKNKTVAHNVANVHRVLDAIKAARSA